MKQKSLFAEETKRLPNTLSYLTDIALSVTRIFSVMMEQLLFLTIEK